MNHEYYTWDELRAMGCPDELLIQYILFTKADLKKYFNIDQSVLTIK